MDLKLDTKLGKNYTSKTQISKNITEPWIRDNFNCPFCNKKLKMYPQNNKCSDFYCDNCNEDFELKSKKGKFAKTKITGSSHKATIKKLKQNKFHLILLERNERKVTGLTFIPKNFFYDEMIEKRKPLKDGRVQCMIRVELIPSFAKIQYVRDGEEVEKKIIQYKLDKIKEFKNIDPQNKSWKLFLLSIIDKIPENIFSFKDLQKIYNDKENKKVIKKLFPNNKSIEGTVLKELQKLRDQKYIKFLNDEGIKGVYKKLF